MDYLIQTDKLSAQHQEKTVLRDISLTIKPRDFITIVGPNGAGKSTLLKCLMGMMPFCAGTVTRKQNLKIGYVPQKLAPDYSIPITVERFISLMKNITKDECSLVLHEVGIEPIRHALLHTLSGGELQRVLLARSLAGSPELLILDEPAQNLDISGQLAFYKLLDRIYEERNISIVMVSHDLHMVMASTRQVVCLFHHICCSGEPHAVTQDPEFISLFGNDMAKMMAVYQHTHNHSHAHTFIEEQPS